jgi:hypothetical protein
LRWPVVVSAAAIAGCVGASHAPVGVLAPATTPTTTTPTTTPTATPTATATATGTATPTDPPRAPGLAPLTGFRAPGSERPSAVVRTVRFDLDALPIATWADPDVKSGFTVTPLGANAFRLWMRSTIYAEVIVENTHGMMEFSAFTGGSFGQGNPPACGPGHSGKFPARWAGLAPKGWTDDGVDVEMGHGDFDVATCAAAPRVSLALRAAAIVPGFVYGLRTKQDDDETLVVYLPSGVMISTSGDPNRPLEHANTGPFTRLAFPVEKGRGSSAALRISPASLWLWARLRRTMTQVGSFGDNSLPHDDLLLNVDVIWQGDEKLGEVTLSMPKVKDATPYAKILAAAGTK